MCEISTRISNEVVRHLHDVAQHLMARQMGRKVDLSMRLKKLGVVDVVVLSLLKTARAGISLHMRACGCAGELRFACSHIDKGLGVLHDL